jgi:hypothetical protein
MRETMTPVRVRRGRSERLDTSQGERRTTMATIMKRWGMWLVALGVVPVLAGSAAAQNPGAAPAAKPGAVEVDVVKLTATVEAVDKGKRTVTVKTPSGRSAVLKID